MSALTCGVDIGSTNVKVTLVDERARAIWTRAVPTPRLPDADLRRAPILPPVVPAGTVPGSGRNGPLRKSGAASAATVVVAGGHDLPMAAATIRRLHLEALVDSMGTANLVYGETTNVAEPRLNPSFIKTTARGLMMQLRHRGRSPRALRMRMRFGTTHRQRVRRRLPADRVG
jgi:sugar (pentulose or hexulose) kinase